MEIACDARCIGVGGSKAEGDTGEAVKMDTWYVGKQDVAAKCWPSASRCLEVNVRGSDQVSRLIHVCQLVLVPSIVLLFLRDTLAITIQIIKDVWIVFSLVMPLEGRAQSSMCT